jgi:hypothetical protein
MGIHTLRPLHSIISVSGILDRPRAALSAVIASEAKQSMLQFSETKDAMTARHTFAFSRREAPEVA